MSRGVQANGREIVETRMARGLTQDALAAQAVLDVKTIRKAEQGKCVDLGTLTRLAITLDTDVSRLVHAGASEPDDQLSHRDVVIRWHLAWEAHDLEALLAVYDEEAVLRLPGGPSIPFGGTFQGREEIRRCHEITWSSVRSKPLRVDEFDMHVSGPSITVSGKKGLYLPSGELQYFSVAQVFSFRQNRILTHDVHYDTLEFVKSMELPL